MKIVIETSAIYEYKVLMYENKTECTTNKIEVQNFN